MKNGKGITLIALVITVIIILILAVVAVSAITGSDGLFNKANHAGTLYNEKAQSEYDEISGMLGFFDNNKVFVGNDSLISKVAEIKQDGIQDIIVNDKTYSANVIIINGDVNLDGTKTYAGSQIINGTGNISKIYEFGNKNTDVATATDYAENMVVLKIIGNLTINNGITLTACKSDEGFGGPKGLFVYCTGSINNHGTITMTARGAKAEGEDVLLWKNKNGSFEYVPAEGAKGALGKAGVSKGKGGDSGANRATGGGGAGGGNGTNPLKTGSGANGTSYSGGSGGGGVYHAGASGTYPGEDAFPNGGSGGQASVRAISTYPAYATGGAGNAPGKSAYTAASSYTNVLGNMDNIYSENGTGGLLILCSNVMNNYGEISSNGSNVNGEKYGSVERYGGGGASGGGSINIFSQNINQKGTVIAKGGVSRLSDSIPNVALGGKGGDGSVSMGSIINGSYVPYTVDISANESLIGKVAGLTKSGIQEISVNTDKYSADVVILNGDITLDGTKTYAGSQIIDGTGNISKIYEFGNKNTDVAKNTENAKNMVIVKINGNLTINEGIGLTACKSDEGLGGPKGMFIYCTGTITNKGTITMTARGAKAEGEYIDLWKNIDGTFEYIPAVGGDGAIGKAANGDGDNGKMGIARTTGGGGAGGAYGTSPLKAGNGSAGTSYSGGSGGGSVYHTSATGTYPGEDAFPNGGAGGQSTVRSVGTYPAYATGGVGNKAGRSAYIGDGANYTNQIGNIENIDSENGTGGLLIIYTPKLNNIGTISSNGSNITGRKYGGEDRYAGGGASGAGSINIFTNELEEFGNMETKGGFSRVPTGISYTVRGGSGGSGHLSLGTIETGQYRALPYKWNKIDARYLLVDVYDHITSSDAVISEITVVDENDTVIPYTVLSSVVYDSAKGGTPHYWTYSSWSYSNLNDGNTAHTSNSQGGANATCLLYTSTPGSGAFARFVIDLKDEKTIGNIKICVGGCDNSIPKQVSMYRVDNYSSLTYAQNVKVRDNNGLTYIGTVEYEEQLTTPTWKEFMR